MAGGLDLDSVHSIVSLRQKVHQAWANVDVQLKRRQELIPNLVNIVKGLRDCERDTQVELAHLRGQLIATPPGQAGPDPQALADTVLALRERYPQLQANEAFLSLHRNLVDTEQRIALARGYFNEMASFYNGRLLLVPDRFLAALAGMKPQPLLTADNFARAAVEVKLAG